MTVENFLDQQILFARGKDEHTKKYFQLDHLFYKNSKLDYVNKLSYQSVFDIIKLIQFEIIQDMLNMILNKDYSELFQEDNK